MTILFSIPGRVRVKISGLANGEMSARRLSSVIEDAPAVVFARYNDRTHNLLVCYNAAQVQEDEILRVVLTSGEHLDRNDFPPVLSQRKRRAYPETFKNERSLSRRWITSVLMIGGIASAFNFVLSRLIAVLLLACPYFIFAAPAAAFHYAVQRAERRRVFIEDKMSVALLKNTEHVYLCDKLFSLGPRDRRAHDDVIADFVFGLRENGITDIAVLMEHNNPDIEQTATLLEIRRIYRISHETQYGGAFQDKTLLVITKREAYLDQSASNGLILHVIDGDYEEIASSDLIVQRRDLDKIPWLFGLSRYSWEIIIRCQNMAIAFGSLTLLAAILGVLGPLGALAAYGMNVVWQPLFIKDKILYYKKEIDDGSKLGAC